MAKIKKKSKTAPKRQPKKDTVNPFEVHFNKQKHDILGRKTINDKGLPGVSRSKALMKRKETLLLEYRHKDKSNKFVDRRIGENNALMTSEERMLARFTAQQKKVHKAHKFNLADEGEELTHKGRALADIEMHEDPRSDDDDDDEDHLDGKGYKGGNLDSDFVKAAHFGGGVLSKNEDSTNGEIPQNRKELIDKLILESKKRKAEKMQSNEKTLARTEKLDAEWNDIFSKYPVKSTQTNQKPESFKPDAYDIAVRELKFESRAQATDKLKNEEEIAKEEFDRLKQLEQDRLMRMQGITAADNKIKHRSADDLDDGFELMDTITDEMEIIYDKDGNLITKFEEDDTSDKDEDDENEEELEEEESEGDDDDDDDEKEEKSEDDDDEDVDEHDDLTDLKELSDNEEDSEIEIETKFDSEKIKIAKEESIKMKELAEKELPYTFEFPESYEAFEELLKNKSIIVQTVIVERIIKCHQLGLDVQNRERLLTFFTYLLQYLQDVALQDPKDCFKVLERLAPIFYDLAQISPSHAEYCLVQVLKEKHSEFTQAKHKRIPSLNTMIFLKLVTYIFPTSDFYHPVSSPAFIFLDHIFSLSRLKSVSDIVRGLFLVTIYMEYTFLSKRFCPSVINFLRGILYMTYPEFEPKVLPHPFKIMQKILLIEDTSKDSSNEEISNINDNLRLSFSNLDSENPENKSDLSSKCIYTALNMLKDFLNMYSENLISPHHLFEPFLLILNKLENHLKKVQNKSLEPIKILVDSNLQLLNIIMAKPLKRLLPEFKKPKLLKQYEPIVKKVYDDKRYRAVDSEKNQRDKLLHKIKRAKKGALRDIRRDNSFIAKVKLKETLRSDMERKAKVKEIFGSAATQQGELRAIKRKK